MTFRVEANLRLSGMRPMSKAAPVKSPMSDAVRIGTERFAIGDAFLSLGQQFSCEGWRRADTPLHFSVREYELQTHCCDCRNGFSQYATRAQIRRDKLRRRCDDCKRPGSITRPVRAWRVAMAPQWAEEARQKAAQVRQKAAQVRQEAETAGRRKLIELRLRRIQKLAEATGRPVPPNICLGDLLRAEQRHIKKTWVAYQRTAKMLGVPVAEVAKMYAARSVKGESKS